VHGRPLALPPAPDRGIVAPALAVWAVWAVVVLATLAVAVALGLEVPGAPAAGTFGRPLLGWDFNWYLAIAQAGYTPDEVRPEYAFYPLLPAIFDGLDALGDPRTLALLVLVPVTSAAAFLGVVATNPSGHRRRTAIALACLPGSFALLLPYTDALTVAAAAWACVACAHGRPGAAGVLGAVAAAARPTGFLVVLPLVLLARRRDERTRWLAPVLPLVSLAGVQVFFWLRSGDPLAYRRAAELWQRPDPLNLANSVGAAIRGAPHLAGNTVNWAIALFLVALLVRLWRMGPEYRPWAVYAAATLAVPIASGQIVGIGRYALLGFPLVWAAADGVATLRRPAVVALGAAVSALLVVSIGHYQP
jgi:hypothetical protein